MKPIFKAPDKRTRDMATASLFLFKSLFMPIFLWPGRVIKTPSREEKIILNYLYFSDDKDFLKYREYLNPKQGEYTIFSQEGYVYDIYKCIQDSSSTDGDFLKLKSLVKEDYIRSIDIEKVTEQIERYSSLEKEIEKVLKENFYNSEFDKCHKQLDVVLQKATRQNENHKLSQYEKILVYSETWMKIIEEYVLQLQSNPDYLMKPKKEEKDAAKFQANFPNATHVQFIQAEEIKNVAYSLSNSGNEQLAGVLRELTDAIMQSKHIDEKGKKEQLGMLKTIGDEAKKPKPNILFLNSLANGLLVTLKGISDIVEIVNKVSPLFHQAINALPH